MAELKKSMIKSRSCILAFFILHFSFFISIPAANAVEIDGIAAKVGDAVILKSDVIQEMRRVNASPSQYVEVRNEMIDRKLILKAAADSKMTMQDWVIEGRIRDIIAKAFDGDRNKLMETLGKQRISYPEWHSRMKDDMIIQAMRWNIIDRNASPGPAAMRREYAEHPERYTSGTKATVSVILLKPSDASRRGDVDAALATNTFAAVAKEFSSDSHAAEGGVWKDVNPAEVFRPEIADEIAKLQCGKLSRWIELSGWCFLLRKDAETVGTKMSFDEAYDQVSENIRMDAARKAYDAWIERLRAETYIKVY